MSIPTLNPDDLITTCDAYLGSRTGRYEWRRVRYRAALNIMNGFSPDHESMGDIDQFTSQPLKGVLEKGPLNHCIEDTDTIFDVGAGWTEFDYCLRSEYDSKARYIPVDGCIDGTDLEYWDPPREAEWFVALEMAEHLDDPERFLTALQENATKGVVISTPNPRTTDVLGMDPTHKTEVPRKMLKALGFKTWEMSFYGSPKDSLLGFWTP